MRKVPNDQLPLFLSATSYHFFSSSDRRICFTSSAIQLASYHLRLFLCLIILMEYPRHQYLGQSYLTFLSLTFQKLIHFQKLRLVHYYETSNTPLLRDLKWINFNSILRLNSEFLMYKNLYVSADSNVKKINFGLRNKVSQRINRNGPDVHLGY